MFEIMCLDSNGNTIDSFTQWDVDQKIVIVLKGYDKHYLDIAPEIHYCNSKSKKALIVRSKVTNHDTITADVPNILLTEHYPLMIYVYLTDSENVSSQKTILSTEIPVRKRVKPDDYKYVENIRKITAQQIKKEIKNELVDDINESDISFKGISFIDVVTNRPYELYVSDGKLMLEALDKDETPYKSVTFIDNVDGNKYRIYVSNGKIYMGNVTEEYEV